MRSQNLILTIVFQGSYLPQSMILVHGVYHIQIVIIITMVMVIIMMGGHLEMMVLILKQTVRMMKYHIQLDGRMLENG